MGARREEPPVCFTFARGHARTSPDAGRRSPDRAWYRPSLRFADPARQVFTFTPRAPRIRTRKPSVHGRSPARHQPGCTIGRSSHRAPDALGVRPLQHRERERSRHGRFAPRRVLFTAGTKKGQRDHIDRHADRKSQKSLGKLEAPPGIEPGMEVLQFPARPSNAPQSVIFREIRRYNVVPSRARAG